MGRVRTSGDAIWCWRRTRARGQEPNSAESRARFRYVPFTRRFTMFTSILVGFDRSEHARVALSQAVDIARTQHASLTVLVAYSTLMPWGPVAPLPQSAVDEFVAGVQSDAQAIADEARSSIPAALHAEILVIEASPAE